MNAPEPKAMAPKIDRAERLERVAAALRDPVCARLVRGAAGRRLLGALQNSVLWREGKEVPRSLLVSSVVPREGRSTVAAALALLVAAVEPEMRVLLVEADPFSASLAQRTGIGDGPGLFDYLEGMLPDPLALARPWGLDNLAVVCGAEAADGQPRRLVARRLAEFRAAAEAHYDLVIYDGPAHAMGGDAVTAARAVPSVLLLVQFRRAYREQIQRFVAELDLHGVDVVGAVLNRRVLPIPRWLYRG
jgi:Mrp family chromosome partitioning ATPase